MTRRDDNRLRKAASYKRGERFERIRTGVFLLPVMGFIFFLKILVLLIDILNTLVCLLPIGVELESEYNNK